jgi:hypothetical protein
LVALAASGVGGEEGTKVLGPDGGVQHEVLAGGCGQTDPPRHQHAENVAMRKERDVAGGRARGGGPAR